mmetsp:Transcript_18056/g.43485  ORF Transcript_18056/g.43485 Transcript_18056/m.43485 type:complete len:314 (-) Transcript_18056:176-1117(-)
MGQVTPPSLSSTCSHIYTHRDGCLPPCFAQGAKECRSHIPARLGSYAFRRFFSPLLAALLHLGNIVDSHPVINHALQINQTLVECVPFGSCELAEDEVGAALGLPVAPDAQRHARELIRPQTLFDAPETIVRAGVGSLLDVEDAQGQGQLVDQHEHSMRRQAVRVEHLLDGPAREVHHCGGLQQIHHPAVSTCRAELTQEVLVALHGDAPVGGDGVDCDPACVVARASELRTRVAEPHDEQLLAPLAPHGLVILARTSSISLLFLLLVSSFVLLGRLCRRVLPFLLEQLQHPRPDAINRCSCKDVLPYTMRRR